jgi:hypothetical protein
MNKPRSGLGDDSKGISHCDRSHPMKATIYARFSADLQNDELSKPA